MHLSELSEITKRRKKQGISESATDCGTVGIALSGGGVRSAAFSLGALQKFYSRGRLRAVDFLSTVSGGGYTGALFSGSVMHTDGEIDWAPRHEGTSNRLVIEPSSDGKPNDTLKRLSMHGRMMRNILRMFSRQLWGFLINTTFIMSGCVAVAAVLAFVIRS